MLCPLREMNTSQGFSRWGNDARTSPSGWPLGDILEAMDGGVGTAVEERLFEFFDKYAGAAECGEAAGVVAVAERADGDELEADAGIGGLQLPDDDLGLSDG